MAEEEKQRKYLSDNKKYKTTTNKNYNTISVILRILGWLLVICGLITGTILGKTGNFIYEITIKDFNIVYALFFWVTGIISGVLLIALAKIINLLVSINKKIQD